MDYSNCIASKELEYDIQKALQSYKKVWQNPKKVYEEVCFCILTPQSSAKRAMKTIELLKANNLLHVGTAKKKEKFMNFIRFHKTKAKRLVEVQEKFPHNKVKNILTEQGILKDQKRVRNFLVNEVNGYGYKEASHFMRNIGFFEVAILDRHILKNLVKCGVIDEIPKTLSKKKYLEIEEKMENFCKKKGFKFEELDLIFWSNETGEVLK